MPAGRCWVHVGDRGADAFEAMATARLTGCHFLFRLCQDRKVRPVGGTADGYLMQLARALEPQATDTVPVASKGGRPGRVARVCLAQVRVLVRPSTQDRKWRGHGPLVVTVIRIWEPDPPAGVDGLEWVLGTDRAVQEPGALLVYRDWYLWRWRTAEEYHKVQKSGCRIEDLRFATRARLLRGMAVLSVVAVRVLGLRWQRDAQPDAPAERVASALEVSVLERARGCAEPVTTVRQFVDGVARLGGYLGRKCDGPPGWQSVWRGYQRLADILMGIELAQQLTTDKLPRLNTSG